MNGGCCRGSKAGKKLWGTLTKIIKKKSGMGKMFRRRKSQKKEWGRGTAVVVRICKEDEKKELSVSKGMARTMRIPGVG